ncbi:MAG: hypothetical protein OSA99_04440 [Acidimicrobiales bacterium]|nr:hypothetical protein [Acidimicrobiales bacterium]
MRRIRNALVIFGLLGGVLVGTASTANAGGEPVDGWVVTSELNGYVDVLEIALQNNGAPCDEGTTEVTFYTGIEPIGSVPLSGANAGTIVVPDDLSETIFGLEIECEINGDTVTETIERGFDYAGLDVTKAIEGPVPDGTEFVVEVDCAFIGLEGGQGEGPELPDAGPYDLTFAADGGTNRVWFSDQHSCELTETEDGGAQSTTFVSEDCGAEGPGGEGATGNGAELVAILDADQCDATVTNVFAATTTGSTTTTSTTTTSTTEPDDDVSPATAAQPTTASPTFTG